jgi:hypothetical protein
VLKAARITLEKALQKKQPPKDSDPNQVLGGEAAED